MRLCLDLGELRVVARSRWRGRAGVDEWWRGRRQWRLVWLPVAGGGLKENGSEGFSEGFLGCFVGSFCVLCRFSFSCR